MLHIASRRLGAVAAAGALTAGALVALATPAATTSGAPYERYAFERVHGPLWPDGRATFSARLFVTGKFWKRVYEIEILPE